MPPDRVFFTDRNLGRYQVPEILRAGGLRVERHDDHFGPTESDDVWLREVGARGWVVLTRDRRIRYRPHERDALMAAGVCAFLLIGRADFGLLAANFVQAQALVERFLAKHPGPFLAKVYRPPRVALWLSHEAWCAARGI